MVSKKLFNYQSICLYIFICLSLLGFYNHEPWRDELQEYLMCIKSDDISSFLSNRVTNAHPIVWQIIMLAISRFTTSFWPIQIANLILVVLGLLPIYKSGLFQKTSQFILFLFGYYILFEFSIMPRNYGLEIFLIGLSLYLSKQQSNWKFFAYGLLANSNILGLIISFIFFSYTVTYKFKTNRYYILYIFLLLLSLTDIFYQVIVWGRLETISTTIFEYNLQWFSYQISTIWRGFAPIPNFLEFHFWNTNIIGAIDIKYLTAKTNYFSKLESWLYLKRVGQLESLKLWSYILLSTSILIGIVISFWKDKKLIFLFFLGAIPMFILFAFIWHGSVRHHGHFFLLYLVCYWFLVQNGNQTKFSKLFLTSILILQLPGGIYAYYMDWKYDFSKAKNIGVKINEHFKENSSIIGVSDFTITPISYFTGSNFYSPENKENISFIKWKSCLDPISNKLLYKSFTDHANLSNDPSFLIISKKSGYEALNKYNLTSYLGQNTFDYKNKISIYNTLNSSLVDDENYLVYMFNDNLNDSIGYKINSFLKPLKWSKEKNFKHTNDQCFNIDNVSIQKDEINIEGWSYINGVENLNKIQFITLSSRSVTYYFDTKSKYRNDINKENNVGFQCILFQSELEEGEYDLGLIIKDKVDNYYSYQSMSKKIEICKP